MNNKRVCFNGVAFLTTILLCALVYQLNGGGASFGIPQRKLLFSPSSPSSNKESQFVGHVDPEQQQEKQPSLRFEPLHPAKPPSSSSSSSSSSASSSSAASSSKDPLKKRLLLVTKGRSGSSFTSALIRNDPQVFYTFEPLFVLNRMMHQAGKDAEFLRQKAYALLHAFLQCDFSEVNGEDLDNFQIRLSSALANHFLQCIRTAKIGPDHLNCLFDMIRECKKKDVTFAKVIRFPMRWAESILSELPALKILYLIRDPRAVLKSQARVFHTFKWPEGVKVASQKHCGELDEDLDEIERLRGLYPGRIHIIKYEHGATQSTEYAKEIYHFAGLNYTERTTTYVDSLKIQNEGIKNGPYSLHRNGTKTMNHWRYRAGYNAIQLVDEVCSNVYKKMGYLAAKSQRDLESDRELVDFKLDVNKL